MTRPPVVTQRTLEAARELRCDGRSSSGGGATRQEPPAAKGEDGRKQRAQLMTSAGFSVLRAANMLCTRRRKTSSFSGVRAWSAGTWRVCTTLRNNRGGRAALVTEPAAAESRPRRSTSEDHGGKDAPDAAALLDALARDVKREVLRGRERSGGHLLGGRRLAADLLLQSQGTLKRL